MCGSKSEVFATGSMECYGYAWQTYGVHCLDENNQRCDMQLSIDADYSYFDIHDDTVIQLWNTVANCRNNV